MVVDEKALYKGALIKLLREAVHKAACKTLEETLKNDVEQAHHKDKHIVSVFTDGSDKFWAGIATQEQLSQISLDVEKQQH